MSKQKLTPADRAMGAIMGAFIGDALGVGPHWYYDLEDQRHDYGDWIDGYTTPKTGRYHEGLSAGQLSQAGGILRLTLESLGASQGYNEDDFCRRLDQQLFPLLDGTANNGPGGYTSHSIRDAWQKRVQLQLPWGQCAGNADTTEAIERTLAIAACYAGQPKRLANAVTANTLLTQNDDMVVTMTVAFNAVLGLLIQGHALDEQLSGKLMAQVAAGELPFHSQTNTATANKLNIAALPHAGGFASPDALLTPSYMASAAADPNIQIEPAWKVSQVYGMPCAVYHVLPAAYYLAARFSDDFTAAVLHAINGGGQNMARAMLTGALVGAQVGLSGIPQRFIEGLEDADALIVLAKQLAEIK